MKSFSKTQKVRPLLKYKYSERRGRSMSTHGIKTSANADLVAEVVQPPPPPSTEV